VTDQLYTKGAVVTTGTPIDVTIHLGRPTRRGRALGLHAEEPVADAQRPGQIEVLSRLGSHPQEGVVGGHHINDRYAVH
jgi:hypothetical protein